MIVGRQAIPDDQPLGSDFVFPDIFAASATLALPLLRLFGEDLQRLHLLLVREVFGLHLRFMSREGAGKLLAEGRDLINGSHRRRAPRWTRSTPL